MNKPPPPFPITPTLLHCLWSHTVETRLEPSITSPQGSRGSPGTFTIKGKLIAHQGLPKGPTRGMLKPTQSSLRVERVGELPLGGPARKLSRRKISVQRREWRPPPKAVTIPENRSPTAVSYIDSLCGLRIYKSPWGCSGFRSATGVETVAHREPARPPVHPGNQAEGTQGASGCLGFVDEGVCVCMCVFDH